MHSSRYMYVFQEYINIRRWIVSITIQRIHHFFQVAIQWIFIWISLIHRRNTFSLYIDEAIQRKVPCTPALIHSIPRQTYYVSKILLRRSFPLILSLSLRYFPIAGVPHIRRRKIMKTPLRVSIDYTRNGSENFS